MIFTLFCIPSPYFTSSHHARSPHCTPLYITSLFSPLLHSHSSPHSTSLQFPHLTPSPYLFSLHTIYFTLPYPTAHSSPHPFTSPHLTSTEFSSHHLLHPFTLPRCIPSPHYTTFILIPSLHYTLQLTAPPPAYLTTQAKRVLYQHHTQGLSTIASITFETYCTHEIAFKRVVKGGSQSHFLPEIFPKSQSQLDFY